MKKTSRLILFFCLLSGAIFSFNYINVSKPLNEVLKEDTRNSGIEIKSHYLNYLQPAKLVIDVKRLSSDISPIDVFRVLLHYASKIKDKRFDSILLQSKGKTKFTIAGEYFQRLGAEHEQQNPMYTVRTFPEHLYKPNGDKAFNTWTGGIIGVLGKQMEDFIEFHKQWYIEDMQLNSKDILKSNIDISKEEMNL